MSTAVLGVGPALGQNQMERIREFMTADRQAWIDHADAHFATARREAAVPAGQLPHPQAVVFHAHGCVRALLCARLVEEGYNFPDTQYLVVILSLCVELEPSWEFFREPLRTLTASHLDAQDPGRPMSPAWASTALAICTAFRKAAMGRLA